MLPTSPNVAKSQEVLAMCALRRLRSFCRFPVPERVVLLFYLAVCLAGPLHLGKDLGLLFVGVAWELRHLLSDGLQALGGPAGFLCRGAERFGGDTGCFPHLTQGFGGLPGGLCTVAELLIELALLFRGVQRLHTLLAVGLRHYSLLLGGGSAPLRPAPIPLCVTRLLCARR
jgi:hypothetical protein